MQRQWDTSSTLSIIEKYKQRPILWDLEHEHHCNMQKKLVAWTEISQEMNIEVPELRKKMNCLLSVVRSEQSRLKKSEKVGKPYKTSWYAYPYLQFYLNRKKRKDLPKKKKTTLKRVQEQYILSEDDSYGIEESCCCSNQGDLHLEGDLPLEGEDDLSNADTEDKDECDTFAMYLAHKLRSYSHLTRSHVEYNISNILFHADMGEFESEVQKGLLSSVTTTEPEWRAIGNSPAVEE